MSSQYRTKEFLALQDKWYKKLKKSGFQDAEDTAGRLKVWSLKLFGVQFNETSFRAKEEYYRLARQFFHDHPFSNEIAKKIWQMHSDGVSIDDITNEVNKHKRRTYKRKVQETIENLAKEMIQRAGKK